VEQHVAKAKLQPEDFPLPKQLSREKISEICEAVGISERRAEEVKVFFDDLVSHLRDRMSNGKADNRRGDRDHIIDSHKWITKAQDELKWLGIDGRLAVRSTAAPLADIVSGYWLRHHFPGDAPSRRTLMTRGIPRSGRDPAHDREQEERDSNYQFIRYQAAETLRALLRDLESVLASALATIEADPRARGGLRPLEHRDNALLNLVNIWHRIGKKAVGTRKSEFVAFCHYIFEVWGWPRGGLDRAIPDAIKDYHSRNRNLPK
jgi:hypothetical protein